MATLNTMADEPTTSGPTHSTATSSTNRFVLLACAGVLVLFVFQQVLPPSSAINWQDDLGAALADAARSGKPILINFSSSGCVFCRKMENEVFPQEEVLAELNRFIPVKVNAWQATHASAKYDVTSVPTYVVTDSSGSIVSKINGYVPATNFVGFLHRASPPRTE